MSCRMKEEERKKKKKEEKEEDSETDPSLHFDDDQISKMRDLAKRLSQKMETEKLLKKADSELDNSGSSGMKPTSGKTKEHSEAIKRSKSDILKDFKIKRKSSTECSENSDTNANSKSDSTRVKKSHSESILSSGSEKFKFHHKALSDSKKSHKRSMEDENKDRSRRKKHKRKDASKYIRKLIIPWQKESFQGYTGISLSVRPSMYLWFCLCTKY